MKFFVACFAYVLISNTSALAQMTFCQNDVCVEEHDGVKRTLSKEEVGKLQRGNSRTAIGNIQCKFSTDQSACEKKVGEIFALFPYYN